MIAAVALIAALSTGCGDQKAWWDQDGHLNGSAPPCPLTQPGPIGMTLSANCKLLFSDTGSQPNPEPIWGDIQAQNDGRHLQGQSGGDANPTALGRAQGNGKFRRMTVMQGDTAFEHRSELGLNHYRLGPTVLYHQGERRVTYISLRPGPGVDPAQPSSDPNSDFRTVMQMKQAGPFGQAGGFSYPDGQPLSGDSALSSPVLELQLKSSEWEFINNQEAVWTAPAPPPPAPGNPYPWTRFAFDITYASNAGSGSITVYADLNHDGDFNDTVGGTPEHSATHPAATLRYESQPGTNGSPWALNDPIPDHLRAGIYQSQTGYSCPSGCSMDLDNVQVVGPP